MNIVNELSSLSHWVYFWFGSLILAWFLSFIWMWQFSLSCLLFVIPFIFFIRWWYKNRIHCSLNHVLKPFLHGFINITCLSMLGQFIGLLIIVIIFEGTHIILYPIGFLIYLLISITYYVAIEEILKLFFSIKSRDSVQDPINQITKSHTITSTATGLGYSMCTGIIWTGFAAFQLNKENYHKYNDKYPLFGWLFLVSFIIAVIGMPMHLITGYVIGCKITQKDIDFSEQNQQENNNNNRLSFKSYINVTYYSIFVRSTYIFFLIIGFLILRFNVGGVIIAVFGIMFDYILLIKHTKQIESRLPLDYLQRAGQLQIFGYKLLSDIDIQQQHDDNIFDDEDNNFYNPNDNHIQITAASMDNYCAANLDEPMIIGSNKNNDPDIDDNNQQEMQYKQCTLNDINNNNDNDDDHVELHVNDSILDHEDDDDDESDTHSIVR